MRLLKRALHWSITMSHLKYSTAVKINIFCRSFSKSWIKICLVPMPQYFAAVIRFGSRGPGRKVWPRQKLEKGEFLSLFVISSRRREFSEHFKERDR